MGHIIGSCAACRFWTAPQGVLEPATLRPGWQDCGKAREPDAKMAFNTQGWDSDGGAVMTAPDFGCVQFEQKGGA
jgi:hypothetical protein